MTETAVEPAAAEITEWLGRFEQALAAGDAVAAAALFGDDSYWRDLVAFTWNIKTRRGPRGDPGDARIASSPHVQADGWHATEPPAEADGVTEAWIAFETAVGRGRGHLRLRDGKAWTLLTTMAELKGHEEPKRRQPPARAPSTARTPTARLARAARARGARARLDDAALRRDRRRRAGRHRARRAAAPARRAHDHRREATSGPATPGASATSRSACTTRSGTTTCRTSSSPRTGRCSRRRTRSATGSRCTRR